MTIRRLFPAIFALALALWAAGGSAVSADGELRVSVREVSSGQTSSVQILTKVVDQNGRPIAGLTPSSFSVRAGDTQIPVSRVQLATDAQVGISSLLILDTSASMLGAPLAAARNAASQYVKSLQPVDEVSVVGFASQVQVISDFSQNFAAVDGALGQLTAFGDTALYDAVASGAGRIESRNVARRVAILLSDGGAGVSVNSISRSQAIEAATRSGVPFYVIGLGPSIDAAFLRELATATGGSYFAAPSSSQLAGLFGEISELLRSEYVVTADFAQSGLGGATDVKLRAEAQQGNGETVITVTLPSVPTAPNPQQPGGVPVPVEVPVVEEGGGSTGTILVLLLVVAGLGGLAYWFLRKRRRAARRDDTAVLHEPVLTPTRPEYADDDVVRKEAPPAFLSLESGETFELHGMATIGADADCTHRLPMSPGDFGHGQLRVWFADQRYLIRDVATRPRITVNGRPVTYSFLGEGDVIEVRGVKLTFSMKTAADRAAVPAAVPATE